MRPHEPVDPRWQMATRRDDPRADRELAGGRRLTGGRIALIVAVVGSLAYVAFAMLVVRDTSSIPLLSSGALVLGVAFVAVGIAAAVSMNRASRERRDRDALLLAFGGGLAVVVGLFCFAGAIVLVLVLTS